MAKTALEVLREVQDKTGVEFSHEALLHLACDFIDAGCMAKEFRAYLESKQVLGTFLLG